MKTILGLAFGAVLLMGSRGGAQDVPTLVAKLLSQNADEAEGARDDLLKLGPVALGPLREAERAAQDPKFKKTLAGIADRLEIRKAVPGLARGWGDRWYSVYLDSLHVGWVDLKMEEKNGKIVLAGEIRAQMAKDTVFQVKATLHCEPDEYLTASSLALDLAVPDNTVSATAQLKEGRLVVKAGGNVTAHKIRPNTVVDLAVFPLVTILPRTEGYEIEVLELLKPKLPEPAVLKFDREESIEFGGRRVKARRFMQAADGKERFYWVDAAGQLLRVQFSTDDQKTLELSLSDEARAKDIDTKE